MATKEINFIVAQLIIQDLKVLNLKNLVQEVILKNKNQIKKVNQDQEKIKKNPQNNKMKVKKNSLQRYKKINHLLIKLMILKLKIINNKKLMEI